jgi:predicted RNA binding protein YcfA (HicA-like mRNA interferase family)
MQATGFLERAASYLGSTSYIPSNNTQEPNNPYAPIPTSPLLARFETTGDLKTEFKLSPEEETLILNMVRVCNLVRSLTLFDLFFFDLHTKITALANFIESDEYAKITTELEILYARCIEEEDQKAKSDLREFLNKLIERVLRLHHAKTSSTLLDPNELKIKAKSETILIIETLNPALKLFRKFLESSQAHTLFFFGPLSHLSNCETFLRSEIVDFKKIFAANVRFIKILFSSLCRQNPQLRALENSLEYSLNSITHSMDNVIHTEVVSSCLSSEPLMNERLFPKKIFTCLLGCKDLNQYINKILDERQSSQTVLSYLSGNLGVVTNPNNFDSNDPLVAFKRLKLLEQNFYLSTAQEALLKEIFKESPPEPCLTLTDLLTFTLDQRLEKLQAINPQILTPLLTTLRKKLSAYSFLLRLAMYRVSSISLVGPVNDYSRIFGLFPDNFSKKIREELSSLKNAIMRIPPTLNRNKKLSKTQQLAIENLVSVAKEIDESIIPLVDLWDHLLKASGSFDLMFKSVSLYKGGSDLGEKIEKNDPKVLYAYYEAIYSGYQYCIDNRCLGVIVDFKDIRKSFFNSSTPSEKELTRFGHTARSEKFKIFDSIRGQLADAIRVFRGELNHADWLKENSIAQAREKTELEFKELIFANGATSKILSLFMADLIRLTELELFPKDTVTTEACFDRLCYNVEQLYNTPSTLVPTKTIIHEEIFKILDHIEDFICSAPFMGLIESISCHPSVSQGSFDQGEWIEILHPLEEQINQLLLDSLKSLKPLPSKILERLKNDWEKLELHELKSINITHLQENFFQQGLPLLRPLLIFFDILTILGERPYPTKPSVIPEELANVLDPDGVEELLQELIKTKTPTLKVEIPLLEHSSNPSDTTMESGSRKEGLVARDFETTPMDFSGQKPSTSDISSPLSSKEHRAPFKKKTGKSSPTPSKQKKTPEIAPIVTDKSSLFEPREFIKIKQRKLTEKLKEMGFILVRGGKGSHEKYVMENGKGGSIIVPRNPAKGTLRALGNQVGKILDT